jgi:outer membrane protein assembly factor BamB
VKKLVQTTAVLVAGLALAAVVVPVVVGERSRPSGRPGAGPGGNGVSPSATPPLEWSESKNVRWKVELPGRGAGTPIIWGDRVYVLTAAPIEAGAGSKSPHRFMVMALNRKDGSIAWQHTAKEEAPHEGTHNQFGTMASASAVTDGEHVIASFESRGIFAYDMNGKPAWQIDLGDKRMRNEFGEGSTPALYKDKLFVVWDHLGQSFITALDKRTGKEVWRTDREEIDSWATPLVVEHAGRAQVVTSGTNRMRSYDAETGKIVWEGPGLTANPIPSPVAADGIVYLMSGYRGNSLKAIRLAEAKGEVTEAPALIWSMNRDTPYVPSPLLYDGILYFLKGNTGVLTVLDARTGKPHYELQRLEASPNVFSSPVGAAGRVYVLGQQGTTTVFKHGTTFEPLATNSLEDRFDASPALADGEIYLRGYRYLYCISEA